MKSVVKTFIHISKRAPNLSRLTDNKSKFFHNRKGEDIETILRPNCKITKWYL